MDDVDLGKQILLAAAEEGAIDNFDEEDFRKVAAKARELLKPAIPPRAVVWKLLEEFLRRGGCAPQADGTWPVNYADAVEFAREQMRILLQGDS
jgi:hypothetical protein